MFQQLMIICGAFVACGATSAQTAAELADKYAHHEVYEVQPGVQMTAKFAPDGLVCEMQIEQGHFGKDGVDLRIGIDKEHIDSLIDELVPQSERGEEDKADPSNDMIIGTGQVIESLRSYSNVRAHVLTSHDTTVAHIQWHHRTC
jgi:hypothetical protein